MSHRLKTPTDVRRFLQRVLNETYSGNLDPKVANSLYNGCNVLLSSFRTDEQEKRIEEIERRFPSEKEAEIDNLKERFNEAEKNAGELIPMIEFDGSARRGVS